MCKLVMIDDNPMEHLIMQRLFDRYHLFPHASHALGGQIIIDFLNENRTNTVELPDIIFLDLNMPGFSGWDFLEQFERLYLSFKKHIGIYILSSSICPEEKLRAKQYSFVRDFISKPIKKDRLELLYATHLKITRLAG
jgi:CheY-like chemotaxis protein